MECQRASDFIMQWPAIVNLEDLVGLIARKFTPVKGMNVAGQQSLLVHLRHLAETEELAVAIFSPT